MTVPQAVRQAFQCCLDRFIADTLLIQGANNRRLHYAQGRTLGGSSARNYMIYHRPTIGSTQKWADETKDQSYTFPTSFLTMRKQSTSPVQPYHTRIAPTSRTNRSSVQVEVLCRYRLATTMILLQLVHSQHSERLDRGPSMASKVGDCWGPHMCLRLSTLLQEQDPRRSRVSSTIQPVEQL